MSSYRQRYSTDKRTASTSINSRLHELLKKQATDENTSVSHLLAHLADKYLKQKGTVIKA